MSEWRNVFDGLALLGVACFSAFLCGAVCAAGDYSLEYSEIGFGATISQTAHYEAVGCVEVAGIGGICQSSAHYSISPVVGSEGEGVTRVECWMLFD